jgi:hypothetical protein
MKRIVRLAGVLVLLGGASLGAQSTQCPAGSSAIDRQRITQDACQQALDLFQYMAPQLGTAIAGGNATLGQGGSLGGLGHFVIGLRANVVRASLPQVDSVPPGVTGAQSRQFPTKDGFLPMPVADAAIGVFKGLPLGLTNVGGIDLLVNASYIPKVNQDNVSLDPDTPLKLGYGVRVSALQESLLMPGVSFTYLKRDLPKMTLSGTIKTVNGADSVSVRDLDLETSAWRVVASKSLVLFGIAAGYGRDSYKSSATAFGVVPTALGTQRSDDIHAAQNVSRNNLFADLSINMVLFKLVGEIGQVSGGSLDQPTFNTFAGKGAMDSRVYGSVGLRFGF